MLELSHYKFAAEALGPAKKLNQKFAGAFPVVAVHSPRAIEIRLPTYAHGLIHPVIHPMYLKLASRKSVQKGMRKLIERHFDPPYEVDNILAHRHNNETLEYLVQWRGCGPLQSTWEPERQLSSAQGARDRYWNKAQQRELDLPGTSMMKEEHTSDDHELSTSSTEVSHATSESFASLVLRRHSSLNA